MSIFKRIFGKKEEPKKPKQSLGVTRPVSPSSRILASSPLSRPYTPMTHDRYPGIPAVDYFPDLNRGSFGREETYERPIELERVDSEPVGVEESSSGLRGFDQSSSTFESHGYDAHSSSHSDYSSYDSGGSYDGGSSDSGSGSGD